MSRPLGPSWLKLRHVRVLALGGGLYPNVQTVYGSSDGLVSATQFVLRSIRQLKNYQRCIDSERVVPERPDETFCTKKDRAEAICGAAS